MPGPRCSPPPGGWPRRLLFTLRLLKAPIEGVQGLEPMKPSDSPRSLPDPSEGQARPAGRHRVSQEEKEDVCARTAPVTARARGHRASGHGVFVRFGARPRHRIRSQSPLPTVVVCLGLLVTLGAVIFTLNAGAESGSGASGASALTPGARLAWIFGSGTLSLPAATSTPAPSPPALAAIPNLQPHEVFGFAPYWTLAQSSGFDVKDMSTLAYFSLDVNGDGTVAESGPGWVGYESQDLVDLVDRAHAAGDRVVLTITSFDQHSLDELTSDPSAPGHLTSALVPLITAKSLDGVNIDFEGNGPRDRVGLDNLVSSVSSQLRAVNPHWQITMDTYASSAGDPAGFYDIAGLDPSVDGFFVMAYDMENPDTPSPTAPLVGNGDTDTSALEQYEAVVPRSKIVLGVPAYGYDWPTSGAELGSPATGPATPVSYAQIASMSSPVYWDPDTETPWTSYEQGNQWHEVFFDNPTSIALKARARRAHARRRGRDMGPRHGWERPCDGTGAPRLRSGSQVRDGAEPIRDDRRATGSNWFWRCFFFFFVRADGGRFIAGAAVAKILWDGVGKVVTTLAGGEEIASDKVVCALGRVANVERLDLPKAGLATNAQGFIPVDSEYRTSVHGISAVGDVIGPPSLASTGMDQGRRAVCHALGLDPGGSTEFVPLGVYTIPEMSSVGLTEAEAVLRFGAALVGRAQFHELARGQISATEDGLLKIVADPDGRLVGVQILGDGATELIHVGQMALIGRLEIRAFVDNAFNFPTLAEGYRVAALDALARVKSEPLPRA